MILASELSAFGFLLESPGGREEAQSDDSAFFCLSLQESLKGVGRTHPNPPVGAVLVQNGHVVVAAYHARAGEPHAEAKVLIAAGERARGATLYTTLEPCDHQDKRTPPCAEHIIQAGVARVVIGAVDPNPAVDGKGVARLIGAGIEVVTIGDPSLKKQAQSLIAPFKKTMTQSLPYVILKMASSLDGQIAEAPGKRTQISGEEASRLLHALRNRCDAILIGSNTVTVDNPALTVRGISGARHPLRVIFDSRLRTDPRSAVYRKDVGRAVVVHTNVAEPQRIEQFETAQIDCLAIDQDSGRVDIGAALAALKTRGITSILLEGGSELAASFLRAGHVDEIWWITAPIILGGQGVGAIKELVSLKNPSDNSVFHRQLGRDFLSIIR